MATPDPVPSRLASLARVIARIESSGRPDAIRFEPGAYRLGFQHSVTDTIAALHGCDQATASMLAATSWGLYQIMGFNLWVSCNFKGTAWAYLADSAQQFATFRLFLAQARIDWSLGDLLADPAKLHTFAATYNGDADAYAPAIVSAAHALGLTA